MGEMGMTPFGILAKLAGLSQREAAEFHRVRLDTVKSWSSGRNACKPEVLAELRGLIAAQEHAARETLVAISWRVSGEWAVAENPDISVEIGYPATDEEARALGWPCIGAWSAMAARILAVANQQVRLVPRASTAATKSD